MRSKPLRTAFLTALVILLALITVYPAADRSDEAALRAKAANLMKEGLFKEALDLYSRLVLDRDTAREKVPADLLIAVQCLQHLNRHKEIDAFLEKAVTIHGKNWRLLWKAARAYIDAQHWGYMVSGKFERGPHRGGGDYVLSMEYDRVLALRLMVQAMALARNDEDHGDLGTFCLDFARMVALFRSGGQSWRLQVLTDLGTLPDFHQGYYYNPGARGAPVDENGKPVYYMIPDSWESAGSDGERWRWLLETVRKIDPERSAEVRITWAHFLFNQFGVQTMADYGWFFGRRTDDNSEPGTFALHTLGEGETMAKLATGVKRFELPDEFNFIKIYRELTEGPKSDHREQAWNQLAQIFENRRQYDKALLCWQESIERHGPGRGDYKIQRVKQIRDNWCTFEPTMTQPAGSGATIDFRFRNGSRVSFEAHAIDIDGLLADTKAYLKSNPRKLDGEKYRIDMIGYRLIEKNQTKYIGKKVASWDLELKPRPKHFDKRITITTPLQKAGAYLLTATMEKGNTSRVVVWLADTVIVSKNLSQGACYFVADSRTGKPIPKANVEFFGYKRERIDSKVRGLVRKYDIITRNFAEFTDENGLLAMSEKQMTKGYQWLVMVRTDEGRLAFLDFARVWYRSYKPGLLDSFKSISITDRPVYRPEQTVKFKCWVRQAKYDLGDEAPFAHQEFELTIKNPKGEKVLEKVFTTDGYGGFDGEYPLPDEAALGSYWFSLRQGRKRIYGTGTFRVEEYKKPEFEVIVKAPDEPVTLGDEFKARIEAKYYFGAPVTSGKVKVKVTRSSHEGRWYPAGPWDWFYGTGYWWFGQDYLWYPGWNDWGCCRPIGWWTSWSPEPPEVVMEHEQEIGEDGTLEIGIDTAFAKEIHGDQDHRYEIFVEVTDESRRTITGQGQVLAARKPFNVYTWVDRGFYRLNDTIEARFQARSLDGKPVKGKAGVDLFRIEYDDEGKPKETSVRNWDVEIDASGSGRLQIKASEAGQYRLSCRITDAKARTEEGGYIFLIRGSGFDGSGFRFNDLELTVEKKEYAPGDRAKVLVNTNRVDSTVLLFLRPVNGTYRKPEVIALSGKSALREMEIAKSDMPNIFVEALTVSNGRVFTEMREIVVPPEKRVLDLEVMPSAETYKPGEEATIRFRVKDHEGKPFQGSTVITVYDKSVEYISGGSNVPEIRAHFWKWRRKHNAWTASNLTWAGYSHRVFTSPAMHYLGVFGYLAADTGLDLDAADSTILETATISGDTGRRSRDKGVEGEKLRGLGYGGGHAPPAPTGEVLHEKKEAKAEDPGAPPMKEPTVRTKFADTAFWAAAIETDADGCAEVSFAMPENLTAWKIKTWAMGRGTEVGEGSAEVVTRKNLLLRLQAPRFFVEKDEVVLSANIHNYLDREKTVRAVLELEGGSLEILSDAAQDVAVASNGEKRVDWRVKVKREGEAVVRMKALSDEESDAMEMRFPVFVHGMAKTDSYSGSLRPGEEEATITLDVPTERRVNESRLEIRYSPTLAGAMVDALPYLADYPYGCTEQTLNRFVPAVITQKVLRDMGLDLASIKEKRTNLNAQQIGDPGERAAQWKRFERNPVFDEALLADMVKRGLERLTAMQLSDGGWGWFSGRRERSSAHTTAVVVHGLQTARANDMALVPGVLEKGIEWLKRCQSGEVTKIRNAPDSKRPYKSQADNLDAFVYMVLGDAGHIDDEMRDFLYRDRNKISVYAKAMFALALHREGRTEKRDMVKRNIEQFLVKDGENQTCWLNLGGWWWHWYGSEYEAHAYYLKLLAAVEPESDKASGVAKYLINNRRHGTYWKSTRDTALCIEALADYMRASGEAEPEMTVEILLDGRKLKEVAINAANLFTFDGTVLVLGDAVESGKHELTFRKKGNGPLYFNAYLTCFSLEDFITRAGLEIKVNRRVYKLIPEEKEIDAAGSRGQAVRQKVEKFRREPLENLSLLKSGDLVEVELTIESKNDYEYIVFEDMKAAGFEPVDVQSGYLRKGLRAYMELRDERVAFFVKRLARGTHSVSYRLRAEIPGRFSALPARGFAMYAPELKANSDEIKLNIED